MASQVAAAAVKRGKISKSIANASAKGVSRVNAIIQRTSKAVKVLNHLLISAPDLSDLW